MKSQKNIFIAFMLNLLFAGAELIGGSITGSVAIVSDSIHDLGDAMSIGISFFLERKSKKKPDNIYTYGYGRYSVAGSVITTVFLLAGSVTVCINAVRRIISPTEIDYNGMIVLALVGAAVNFLGAFFTREGDSLNQKAVNLHMLEDVLGWIVVLVGAVVMRFTDLRIIDPLMSIGVAVFILVNAVRNLNESLKVFLERVPEGADIEQIKGELLEIEGVRDVHHVHLWTVNGFDKYITMHLVAKGSPAQVKTQVRERLETMGIGHSTLEIESEDEVCASKDCSEQEHHHQHSHHHHHHGHNHGHHHH